MTPDKDFPFLKLLALRKVFQEAGVGRLRDLRDDDKRERVIAALDGGGEERALEGVRRDLEQKKLFGREAREERRGNRRH